jgi:patatin-like phospholipase/acyl hydrolase
MFRILCLDGGGIKGVFTAAVLKRIQEMSKTPLADHFDLICGTSTGGLLAIGLGLGLTPAEMLEFYRQRGPAIFPSTSLVERKWGLLRQALFGPKFSHDILRSEIAKILTHRKFGESRRRLVICSYDAVYGRIYLFKTAHDRRFVNDIDLPAVDVALATSAAPTYFAAAAAGQYGKFVDGGVWANCPAMVGLVEAISFLGVSLTEISLLSIGTTAAPFSIANNTQASALKWNLGLINLMFEAQMESAAKQAGLLLQGRMHRINFQATAGRFSLDNASARVIDDLTNIGVNEAQRKEHTEVVFTQFVNGTPAAPFEPFGSPTMALQSHSL